MKMEEEIRQKGYGEGLKDERESNREHTRSWWRAPSQLSQVSCSSHSLRVLEWDPSPRREEGLEPYHVLNTPLHRSVPAGSQSDHFLALPLNRLYMKAVLTMLARTSFLLPQVDLTDNTLRCYECYS
jgi:hypothetical protein